jgi:uncharacterized membrane protein HdeD (DUF308 family)
MIDKLKKIEKSMIFSTIVTLVLGLLLTIFPDMSLKIIAYVIGISLMVMGGAFIIDYVKGTRLEKITSISFVLGVIFIGIGLFFIVAHAKLLNFIMVIIGIIFLIKGLCKVQLALNVRGVLDAWKYNLIVGAVTLSIGLILVLNPGKSVETFLRVVGIFIIVGSFADLAESIWILRDLDKVKDADFIDKKRIDILDTSDEEEVPDDSPAVDAKDAEIIEKKKSKKKEK